MELRAQRWSTRHWSLDLTAILAGALLPLALAPFYLWPLGIIAPALLAFLLVDLPRWRAYLRALLFGLGMYGVGASWVFRSIYDFGFANLALALTLTALFVIGLALVFAVPFYVYGRYFTSAKRVNGLAFVILWTLGEWSRSWFLTGFPWLYVGYAHIDTWLAGWAPIGGVFSISFLSVASGVLALKLCVYLSRKQLTPREQLVAPVKKMIASTLLLIIWGGGFTLGQIQWTHKASEQALKVGIVQPNIPQHYKWEPYYYPYIMQTMRDLSRDAWADVDLLLWPENAIPLFYHEANDYLEELHLRADASDTALITGILYDAEEPRTWYNAIIGLGRAEGTYFKQRLVPFGEYVPMEDLLRGTLRFFNLPHSVISAGQAGQAPLRMGSDIVASSICYEVVYPDLVAEYADTAKLLLTISNDAWFGDSIGPIQHFQMAQMRALENGKYMLRATNNGISGVISDRGKVLATLPHFEQGTLLAEAYLMDGHTPFSRWGSFPIILFCALALALCFYNNDKTQ